MSDFSPTPIGPTLPFDAVGDDPGDRERRGRARRRRVADVDDPVGLVEHEVVEQRPVGRERLRADAGRPGQDVRDLEPRQELAGRRDEAARREVAHHLAGAHPPVLPRQPPECRRADRLPQVAKGKVAAPVALAGERQHGVRAQPDLAVGTNGRVDAEERELRVRHGIDEAPHQMAALGLQHEVVAAERHDARLRGRTGQRREAIGVDASADDHALCLDVPAAGLDHRHLPASLETDHLAAEQELAPGGADVVGERLRDAPEVDDRRLGRVQRLHPRDVRLELADPVGPDQLGSRHAVLERAPVELLEPWDLRVVGGDDHLPAAQDRDPALLAVGEDPRRSLDAEPCLERAGRVVDPAVDDTARVAGLVRRDDRLLVEHRDPCIGTACLELARGREADDPGADDGDVEPRGAHKRLAATRCLASAGHICPTDSRCPTSVGHLVPRKPSTRLRSSCTRGRSRPRAVSAGRPLR